MKNFLTENAEATELFEITLSLLGATNVGAKVSLEATPISTLAKADMTNAEVDGDGMLQICTLMLGGLGASILQGGKEGTLTADQLSLIENSLGVFYKTLKAYSASQLELEDLPEEGEDISLGEAPFGTHDPVKVAMHPEFQSLPKWLQEAYLGALTEM